MVFVLVNLPCSTLSCYAWTLSIAGTKKQIVDHRVPQSFCPGALQKGETVIRNGASHIPRISPRKKKQRRWIPCMPCGGWRSAASARSPSWHGRSSARPGTPRGRRPWRPSRPGRPRASTRPPGPTRTNRTLRTVRVKDATSSGAPGSSKKRLYRG